MGDLQVQVVASQALAFLLAVVWCWAAVGKLRHLSLFTDSAVMLLAPTPEGLVRRLAPLLPAVEFAAAALVLLPATRMAGFALSALAFALFVVILARAVRQGTRVGCACFGNETENRVTIAAVVRTVLLGTAAFAGIPVTAGAAGPQTWPSPSLAGVGVGAAAVLGAVPESDPQQF